MARQLGSALAIAQLVAHLLPASVSAVELSPFTTVVDTDWAWAGTGGMRGLLYPPTPGPGTGSITLSGVTGPVSQAYLYWHGPNGDPDPLANAAVSFAGTPIVGSFLGLSSDDCWGLPNSVAFRADVTGLVAGDGSYALADFSKPNSDINGVSLLVFFDDGDATNNRDVRLFDGNDANIVNPFDSDGWNLSLPAFEYAGGTAHLVFGVGDGQPDAFADTPLLLDANVLDPGPDVFGGTTVPSSGNSDPLYQLWDIKSYEISSYLAPGTNTLSITTGTLYDCISCVHLALDLPTAVPEPGTGLLLGVGLALLSVARHRSLRPPAGPCVALPDPEHELRRETPAPTLRSRAARARRARRAAG